MRNDFAIFESRIPGEPGQPLLYLVDFRRATESDLKWFEEIRRDHYLVEIDMDSSKLRQVCLEPERDFISYQGSNILIDIVINPDETVVPRKWVSYFHGYKSV